MKADEITTRALRHVLKDANQSRIAVVVIAIELSDDDDGVSLEASAYVDVSSNLDSSKSLIEVLNQALETVKAPDFKTWTDASLPKV